MSERINQLTIITGMRQTGKTTYAKLLADKQQQKVLVVDTYDHPSYRDDFVDISLDEVAEWAVTPVDMLRKKQLHKRRLYGGDIQANVQFVFTVCFDALVILEDAAKIFDSNIPRRLKSVVIDHRNRGLDVIMMFHSYADIAPYLCRGMWDVLITFRTEDNLHMPQTKFAKWHIISAEQEKLRRQPDRHLKTVLYRE